MLEVKDERLLPFIQDYNINLIEPRKLKKFELFQTDLREVLEVISVADDRDELRSLVNRNEAYLSLGKEAAMLIDSCTGIELHIEEEEEKVNVCKAVMELREEGREEGRNAVCREMIEKKIRKGKALEVIADEMELEVSAVKLYYDEIIKNLKTE